MEKVCSKLTLVYTCFVMEQTAYTFLRGSATTWLPLNCTGHHHKMPAMQTVLDRSGHPSLTSYVHSESLHTVSMWWVHTILILLNTRILITAPLNSSRMKLMVKPSSNCHPHQTWHCHHWFKLGEFWPKPSWFEDMFPFHAPLPQRCTLQESLSHHQQSV